ncbi:MAG: methionine adenosyltransferase [Thiobacillus sp.]|nr:methionine adenosyltransferase [Thiobacillus sp.]
MNTRRYLFTSESVSEGHPDKIADQISDAILDAFLAAEPEARVACETLVADNLVVITGEFKTVRKALFDEIRDRAEAIARQVLRDIGYRDAETGIDPDACEVQVRFNHQSIQIDQGITLTGGDIGAGDQGMMFGYACDETPDLMPYPLWLAHRLVHRQAELRKSGVLPWLRPDAKSQVTVAYEGRHMAGVETVVISTQIARGLDPAWVAREVAREIVDPLVPAERRTPAFRLWVNPAGPFEIGGPNGDTGLTGRKIIVDTYGGACPHGGGAFSGKDPTKVDRSAVSLLIDTHGTGSVPDEKLEDLVRRTFSLTPRGMIDSLDLRRPIYRATATYGHFGRVGPGFSWERLDQVEKLGGKMEATQAR